MKILLLQRVASLGQPGQIVEVAESYARNFLLPKKLAVAATAEAIKQQVRAAETKQRDQQHLHARSMAILAQLQSLKLVLHLPASGAGKLFAAIQERDIRSALTRDHGVALPATMTIGGLPIKHTGDYQLTISTPAQQSATLHLTIQSI